MAPSLRVQKSVRVVRSTDELRTPLNSNVAQSEAAKALTNLVSQSGAIERHNNTLEMLVNEPGWRSNRLVVRSSDAGVELNVVPPIENIQPLAQKENFTRR